MNANNSTNLSQATQLNRKSKSLLTRIRLDFNKNGMLTLIALPGILFFFIFAYLPIGGVIIAFKNYKVFDGIFGSKWQNPIYNNFIFLFTSDSLYRATRNTILLNLMFIVVGTVFAVVLAVILNEVKQVAFKRIIQSVTFLPFFMSWIVVSVMTYSLFSNSTGLINNTLVGLGFGRIDWYTTPIYWPFILTGVCIWKFAGFNTVIYLATITGIDVAYYEAAEIDGASARQKIFYITIPFLIPPIVILTLLSIGRIMNADFGMFYGIIGENALLYPTTDVLDTFIFRNLRKIGDIGMASAGGLYQSTISFILLLICNKFAQKVGDRISLF